MSRALQAYLRKDQTKEKGQACQLVFAWYFVAHFLQSASPEAFPYTILGKISETHAVRIIGTTLHVNVIRLWEKDELNLILLVTSLRVVDQVKIHNFQINFYLTACR